MNLCKTSICPSGGLYVRGESSDSKFDLLVLIRNKLDQVRFIGT
jgi:hypothetical protein